MLFAPSGKARKRQKKGDFGRFWPISRQGGQTPLKPPFVTPPFAAAQLEHPPKPPFWKSPFCEPPGSGAENKSTLFGDFLLLSAVLRFRGRKQNPRQTPVRTKVRLKRFPTLKCRCYIFPVLRDGETTIKI